MWRDVFNSLYPDALRRTYRVPPEHFNKVSYDRVTVPGAGLSALNLSDPTATPGHRIPPASQSSGGATPGHRVPPASQPSGGATPGHNVPPPSQPSGGATPGHNVPPPSQQTNPPTEYSLWTQEPHPPATPSRVQESDILDDFCQASVLKNLQELGKAGDEVMFIISQLDFGSYLNKPSYAAAVAQLPRPIRLAPCYREGDFDILVIHRHYGILVGEIKSVGMPQAKYKPTPRQVDCNVASKVRKAVGQLHKSETVVKHLVSDIAPRMTVRKTLFLPFVSSTQLQRVLTADSQLEQVHTHTRTHRHRHTHTEWAIVSVSSIPSLSSFKV